MLCLVWRFSRSVVSDPLRPLCPRDSPDKSTGTGCHFHLQRIFLTQRSSLGLLHWRADSLPTELWGKPNVVFNFCCIAKWLSYTYTYIYILHILFHSDLSQDTGSISLYCAIGLCFYSSVPGGLVVRIRHSHCLSVNVAEVSVSVIYYYFKNHHKI